MATKDQAASIINEFQSEVEAVRASDDLKAARLTTWLLAGFIVSLVALLTFATVDRVVRSNWGKVVSAEPLSVYQPLEQSIIKTIDVREGEFVRKGQLLATLDSTFASADVTQYKQQLTSLDAQIVRLEAQLSGSTPQFSPNSDPEVKKANSVQQVLYAQLSAQYSAEVNSFDQKIGQTRASIQKLEADARRYREREDIAKKIEGMRSTLAERGSGSILNQLTSIDTHLELQRTVENTVNALNEAQHQLSSLNADREAYRQRWSAALSQELVKARTDREAASSQLEKASKRQDLVELRAQDDSIVLSVAKLSAGSILKPGDPFLTLVPTKAKLETEVHIYASEIGFVRAGDKAKIAIDAFNPAEHGYAEGAVKWISEGSFTTDEDNKPVPPYYKARITIDSANLINVPPTFRLIPGMTLSADILIGTRSLGRYVLGGLARGMAESMREP